MNERQLTLCASAPFVDGQSAVQVAEALGSTKTASSP